MRSTVLAALLLIALALSACGNAVANPQPPATVVSMNPPIGAIKSAVTMHLSKEGISKITQAQVEVEKIEGDAARVRVLPDDPNAADAAWLFLKHESGMWKVVAGPGTAFTPDDMKSAGLPEDLLPTQ